MKTIILPIFSALLIQAATAFDHTHAAWDKLVSAHVKTDGVDYASFKKDSEDLKAYLKTFEPIKPEEFNGWKGNEQLAFLINLYNAATIDLVLSEYPIKSFKDETGGENGPWKVEFIKTLGATYTLDQVEHELIRKYYNEPRIHFAVNCASEGCPALRNEAFSAEKLVDQLEDGTKKFLEDSSRNSISGSTLTLSPIFDWFKEDFIKKAGSVEAFVSPYFEGKTFKKGSVTLKYSDYGWSLNEAKAAPKE